MDKILNSIFDCLDMCSSTGLATKENQQDMDPFQRMFYNQVHKRTKIDAVYFLRDAGGSARIPLIYFSVAQRYDPKQVAELHRLAWNLGDAPLLFVVTPDAIRIYNNYDPPRTSENGNLCPEAGLIETLSLAGGLVSQQDALRKYNREMLESGEYWRRSKDRFNIRTRVDATLLSNLKIVRKTMISQITQRCGKSSKEIISAVHSLLTRSVLIKYLEERKYPDGKNVFPDDYFSGFLKGAEQYSDILMDKEATYCLFDRLKEKFNGDILYVADSEREIITGQDLEVLRTFLSADNEMNDGQFTLWPLYSFDVIPIQLISSVYELFFHLSEEDDERGTYYTPLHLVSLLMDEVYPWEGVYKDTAFFDPSCGSGIFLVEAYRRLVCRWISDKGVDTVSCMELNDLMKKSIYGTDINDEALRVASFSLGLAMCDFLDPEDIWEDLTFPRLLGENLSMNDFFDEDAAFNNRSYDVIIGNPPWQSAITGKTEAYLKKTGHVIGDKQIAQAFSIKCPDLCAENGIICLLMPSKGLLFNRSENSRKYRSELFSNNTVLAIINLSVYRKVLFDHATGPAAAIIYAPGKEGYDQPVIYCTPKPAYTIEDSRKFCIDPTDICRIPRDLTGDDRIWKTAMWGSPRDLELIGKLQNTFASMHSFINRHHMVAAEGFKRGNRMHKCQDFIGLPLVDSRSFRPYYVSSGDLRSVEFDDFERTVNTAREIFRAPHLIMKQTHKCGTFLSMVLDYNAVFSHSFLGIHGDIKMLKYLSIIIGSRVFSYYHILTDRTWMVERDTLEAGDIRQTPIPEPDEGQLAEACRLFDNLAVWPEDRAGAEQFVRSMYRLKEYECYQIDDVMDYIYDYFTKKQRSVSFTSPNSNMFKLYYEAISNVLRNTFGSGISVNGELYSSDAPLSVLVLNFTGQGSTELAIIRNNDRLDAILRDLDNSVVDNRQMVFIRRNLRIYEKDRIFIVKPSQCKYWTYSAACRDADEIFEDVSASWR